MASATVEEDKGLERKLLRSLIKRVHPDLFSNNEAARAQNAESLKVLNGYLDDISQGETLRGSSIEFWVKQDGQLVNIRAELPSYGSVGPLLHAFGLITTDQLSQGFGRVSEYRVGKRAEEVNFLEWLSRIVSDALRQAEHHDAMKMRTRELRFFLEETYMLDSIMMGSGDIAASPEELKRQLEALKTLEMGLFTACEGNAAVFEGLSFRIYHPDTCPIDPLRGKPGRGGKRMEPYVAEDGCLHVVADHDNIQHSLGSLDLSKARLLSNLNRYWLKRVKDLVPGLRYLLKVQNVWCDTRSESTAQQFVLWAGTVFRDRTAFESALAAAGGFSFSILLHSDTSSPMVDFLATSAVLQVRTDCPPHLLMDFLLSEAGLEASEAAETAQRSRAEEEVVLEEARAALGAKHVIRVVSLPENEEVILAARRLVEHAEVIGRSVNLAGASIAIDDCYEVWDSGFISIPYDFQVSDLEPQLRRLLGGDLGSAAAPRNTSFSPSSAPSVPNPPGSPSFNGNGRDSPIPRPNSPVVPRAAPGTGVRFYAVPEVRRAAPLVVRPHVAPMVHPRRAAAPRSTAPRQAGGVRFAMM